MTKHLVIGLLFAMGCKGGLDGKLDDLDKIKDEMCACKDKKCTDDVHEKYIAWKKGNSKDDKPSKDQDERYHKIREGLMDCRHKIGDAGSGAPPAATPPAADGSAAK